MIELGLLGLLNEQNLHGYELKKQLSEVLGSWSLSFGSLYPALNRLERAELVRAVDAPGPAEPAIPMTGALSGELAAFRGRLGPRGKTRAAGAGRRARKVYGITERGRGRLAELLAAPGPDDDRTFSLRVAFCGHLPPPERLALFERRRAELVGLAADRRSPRAGGRRLDPYRRSLRERDARALDHDLAWLDELVEAARADLEAARSGASSLAGRAREVASSASPSLSTLTTRRPDPTGAPKEGSA
jgi:DNA-binding PadR family transcriptional regulator